MLGSTNAIQTLKVTSQNLQIRVEVEHVLQSILQDVESAHTLTNTLRHTRQLSHLQKQYQTTLAELEERRIYDETQRENRESVGDAFVGELWILNSKLTKLTQWKVQNEHKILEFEEVQRRLSRSEELLRSMERNQSLTNNPHVNYASDTTPTAPTNTTTTESAASSNQSATAHSSDVIPTSSPTNESIVNVQTEEIHSTPAPAPENASPTAPPSVVPPPQDAPGLMNIDTANLLEVFSYLEAFDVLNTAQINISFYSRVDSLFGIGSGTTSDKASENVVVEKEDDGYDPEPLEVPNSTPITTSKLSVAPPDMTDVTEAKGAGVGVNIASMFSAMIQPKTQPQQPNPTTAPSTAASPAPSANISNTSADGSTDAAIKSFASMAGSMADKLTQAELRVVLNMTKTLRAKDVQLKKLTAEKEDMSARLESTQSVKEFLVSKVRDTDRELTEKTTEVTKIEQQIASDQEVIGFLDARVQELETSKTLTETKLSVTEQTLKEQSTKSERRQTVLEDMLQFERQQLSDAEKEWKTQKKVLVKEVKHCRAQLLTLKSESSSVITQNGQLKQALLTMGGKSR